MKERERERESGSGKGREKERGAPMVIKDSFKSFFQLRRFFLSGHLV